MKTPPAINGHASNAAPALLPFRPSPEATIGVELELQILDPASGELVPGAQRILDACAQEGLDGVDGEFLLCMLEVKTGVCRDVAEVRDQLFPLLGRVRNLAATLGYDLAVGGTHPFSRPCTNVVSPHERYQRIRKRQGWLAYHEAIFGLHVHVGVPDAASAVGVMNLLTPYLPHLLALSASSPFWQGVDTEHASARATLFRPSAHAGVPPHYADWADFCHFFHVMQSAGVIPAVKDVYWDIRPRPDLGTVEFRIFDAPLSLGCLLALAALTRCLVVNSLRRLRDNPALGRGNPALHWLAAENRGLASRYGLEATCVRRPGGARRTLLDDLDRLFDHVMPVAREVGEDRFLGELLPLARFEPGASRQRRLYRQAGAWQAVIHDARTRWARELDEAVPPAAAPPAEAAPEEAPSAVREQHAGHVSPNGARPAAEAPC